MLITLVIPFHNEEESLPVLLAELKSVLATQTKHEFEVLMVDDVSSDRSGEIVAAFAQHDSRFRLIRLTERGGQTGAFARAFQEMRGEYLIRMDADLQDHPKDLPILLAKVDEGYDLVMGLRQNRQHSFTLRLLTAVYDLVARTVFRTELHSNSGSFIAFRAKYLRALPMKKNDHRYLPLISMRRGAERVVSVPVTHRDRRFGKSKYKIAGKVLFGFVEAGRLYYRLTTGFYDRTA